MWICCDPLYSPSRADSLILMPWLAVWWDCTKSEGRGCGQGVWAAWLGQVASPPLQETGHSSGVRLSGFEFHHCHWWAVQPQTSFLSSLSLSILTFRMGLGWWRREVTTNTYFSGCSDNWISSFIWSALSSAQLMKLLLLLLATANRRQQASPSWPYRIEQNNTWENKTLKLYVSVRNLVYSALNLTNIRRL